MRRDELHHVLVAGDDEDLMVMLGGLARERADNVVGLEALGRKDGNAQRLQRAADVGNLAAQVVGHGLAVGLVALIGDFLEGLRLGVPLAQRAEAASALIAKDLAAQVEDGGEVLRREVLAQLLDHVDEDIGRRRRQAGRGGHGPAALHRVVGAKDERHGVEQIDGRLGWAWHASESISERRCGRSSGSTVGVFRSRIAEWLFPQEKATCKEGQK